MDELDPWLETVADDASPYQPTKKDVRVLLAEVKRLRGQARHAVPPVPRATFYKSGEEPPLYDLDGSLLPK